MSGQVFMEMYFLIRPSINKTVLSLAPAMCQVLL